MGDRRCCCGSCYIGEDDFTGDDGDPLGSQWHTVSGEFEIDSNQCHTVTAGICITTLRQSAPTRSGADYNIKMRVKLCDFPSSGTKTWGVICGYRTSSDYEWIKFDYDASTGELYPSFMQNTSSVLKDKTDFPAGDPWSVSPGASGFVASICYANVEWSVTDYGGFGGDIAWTICDGGQPSLPASYGMVGFTQGDFDDWYYEIHWESRSDCEYCKCFCRNEDDIDDYLCIPETLYMVIEADTIYSCVDMDGLELELYQSWPDTSGGSPVYDASPEKKWWFSEVITVETEDIWFVLSCEGGVFRMAALAYPDKTVVGNQANNLYFGTLGTPSTTGEWQNVDDSVCNPLELVFENLRPDYTTCDLPGGAGTGERPRACPTANCEITASLDVSWTVTVTE